MVILGVGPKPVSERYHTCPIFSQLLPPSVLQAVQNARLGGPLLKCGSIPGVICEYWVGCGARQCGAAGLAMSRKQVKPLSFAVGPIISWPISQSALLTSCPASHCRNIEPKQSEMLSF